MPTPAQSGAIGSATFDKEQMEAALQAGFLDATEVAELKKRLAP